MHKFLLLTASLAAFSAAPAAFAANAAEDAAYSKTERPIYNSAGACVRTKWTSVGDPCAPAITPPPVKPKAVVAAPVPVASVTKEQRTIYFDFNSAKLTADATTKLDQLANIINNSSEITAVRIHGFTDQIGTTSYNNALAQKRAGVVKAYLDSKSRLQSTQGDIRGLGKSAPDASCSTLTAREAKITCMQSERRVEVEFNAQE